MTSPHASQANQPIDDASGAHRLPPKDGTRSRPHAPPVLHRWWLKLLLQPLLFLAFLAGSFFLLGIVQSLGWLTAPGSMHQAQSSNPSGSYICPMMCTPPSKSPGRCPVCGMKLVPASAAGTTTDPSAVELTPAARRIAGIKTVTVRSVSASQHIQAIGRLDYDEGTRKQLTAYVDGRIEKLYADYTGVEVAKGDTLALLYCPKLYSAQVELLLARAAQAPATDASTRRITNASKKLYASSRQRVIELGMTATQVAALEQTGSANSRLELLAPLSGTVIKKLVSEGQYVTKGDTIYELADLSTLWLMLELFPEDAALVHYGVRVEAEMQSLPGQRYTGRVSFVDPIVNPDTRTVGVRVAMPNDGSLRVGDFAKATIKVPLAKTSIYYDPELADRWISPRHPHVITDAPGACPVCGVSLVPASSRGFTNDPAAIPTVLLVPRSAVLTASRKSIVYVETRPGRFEIRPVVVGAISGDEVVIRDGLNEGEKVASKGNFLIDSQMQLIGNPSLIDPARATPPRPEATDIIDPTMLPPIGSMKMAPLPSAAPRPNQSAEQPPADASTLEESSPPAAPPLPSGPMRLAPGTPPAVAEPEEQR